MSQQSLTAYTTDSTDEKSKPTPGSDTDAAHGGDANAGDADTGDADTDDDTDATPDDADGDADTGVLDAGITINAATSVPLADLLDAVNAESPRDANLSYHPETGRIRAEHALAVAEYDPRTDKIDDDADLSNAAEYKELPANTAQRNPLFRTPV